MEELFKYVWILIVVAILLLLLLSCWRRVPADKAMVITGLKKRVLSGKGGFMIPFLETSCIISLENISMTTDVTEAPSQQGIFMDVIGTAVVKVRNQTESIYKAVEQFCSGNAKSTKDVISSMVEQILEGKLRGIVSTMTVEEINSNRAEFERRVESDINKELDEMGLPRPSPGGPIQGRGGNRRSGAQAGHRYQNSGSCPRR